MHSVLFSIGSHTVSISGHGPGLRQVAAAAVFSDISMIGLPDRKASFNILDAGRQATPATLSALFFRLFRPVWSIVEGHITWVKA